MTDATGRSEVPEYKVFPCQLYPGDWRVEAVGSEGECYVTIFSGAEAKQRAASYAAWKQAEAPHDLFRYISDTGFIDVEATRNAITAHYAALAERLKAVEQALGDAGREVLGMGPLAERIRQSRKNHQYILDDAERHVDQLIAKLSAMDDYESLYHKLSDRYAALEAELDQLRDWRADVTVALQREGGAFFEDVPKHVKALVAERDQLTWQVERLRAALEEVGKFAEAHHLEQERDSHIWLHALIVDIPAIVEAALAEPPVQRGGFSAEQQE